MKRNLDVKDQKILKALDGDSRQPMSRLSKEVGLSKQSASYRVGKLQQQGIITQFYTIVNFTALGYKPYKIFLRMNNLSQQDTAKYLQQFQQMEYVVWTAHCDGHYDIIVGLIARNTAHFTEIYRKIREEYKEVILLIDHSTILSAHQRKKISGGKNTLHNFYVDQDTVEINETDSRILSVLAPNSRLPVVTISKQINITAEATRIRIKNLHKRRIITGSSILVDSTQLGSLNYKVLLRLKEMSSANMKRMTAYLTAHPHVLEVIHTLGKWDLEIDLEAKSVKEFHNALTKIRTTFAHMVAGYDTLLKYKEQSYNYFPIR